MASAFQTAFDAAKKAGKNIFMYKGKAYNTVSKDDLKNASWKPEGMDSMDQSQWDKLGNAFAVANHPESYPEYGSNSDFKSANSGFKDGDTELTNEALVNKYKPTTETPTTPTTETPTTPTTETPTTKTPTTETPTSEKQQLFTKDDIRNLGFRNFSGLVSAGLNSANSNNAFIKSLTKRYGSADTWANQQSRIESELGVSGKYRRFGRGDFGDMFRRQTDYINSYNSDLDRVQSNRRGGPLNKFQQGGSVNMNEQQLQQAFLQFLAQQTGAKSQQELEQIIQQLGEDGLKQAYIQFMQAVQQQQVRAAKFGAKLNYINRLNGKCPAGTEMKYFKSGGRLCKKCMAVQAKGGTVDKPVDDAIQQFKAGRKTKRAACGSKLRK